MASTRRHNARPDARFNARICHYVGLRTLSAIGRPPQPFGMHVCYRNVEMTDLFSCPGVTESKGPASKREKAHGSRTMPMEPQECRQNGLRCRELAERATDSHLKDVLEELAKRWVTRATELERAQALRHANDPTPKAR